MTNKEKVLNGTPPHLELDRPIGRATIDYLVLQLDAKCPHTCQYCFVGDNLNRSDGTTNLPLERRLELIREAAALGARAVSFPGEGEPLAVRGFDQLLDCATDLGMIGIVYTKGLLFTRKWADFAASRNVSVVFSVDSLHEATALRFNKTPSGWFRRMIQNLEYAQAVLAPLSETKLNHRITRLAINHVVTALNYGEQDRIREWCGDDILLVCHGPSPEGWALRIWDKLVTEEYSFEDLVARAAAMSETKGNTTARQDGKCAYYLNGITIGADGSLKLCPASTQSSGRFGSVATSSLLELYATCQSQLLAMFGDTPPPCLVRDATYLDLLTCLDN